MPRSFTTLTALCAALALLLALSPAAFSQAADDQYADPFGDVPEEPSNAPAPEPDQSTEQPSSPSSGGGGNAGGGVPDTATDTQDTAPDATTSDDSASTSSGDELARTGLPAGLLACLGLAMLFTGSLLQLALARPPRSTTRPPPLVITFTPAAVLECRPGPAGWLTARSRHAARARRSTRRMRHIGVGPVSAHRDRHPLTQGPALGAQSPSRVARLAACLVGVSASSRRE